MFKFLKSILSENQPTKSKPSFEDAETRIEREYKSKYGDVYSCILAYNKTIAHCIAQNNVPKYAVEWLAESIQKRSEIDITAIYNSIDMKLPYLCEQESEIWLFESEENPLNNSIEGMYSAILKYQYNVANTNKMNFWINRLLSLADKGNLMAQGLICWRCGVIFDDGRYDGVIPQDLWQKLKVSYESKILNSCDVGEPYAQLAVAKFNRDIDDSKREKLYLSAIEKGLSDACYYYAKFLDQKRFIANKMTVNIPPYGTDEWQAYMKDELALYKKGAELNNGTMAGYCQYRLGDMYNCGDGGVFKDAAMAQTWFKKAYENGYKNAQLYIDK